MSPRILNSIPMKSIKKLIRLFIILLLLLLAAFGIGITGNLLNNRERYLDSQIKTEQTDKKDQEENESNEER